MTGIDDHGLVLPVRTGPSLEESLMAQAQEMAMPQMAMLKLYSSWWSELEHRPFDSPEYVAFNGIPAIVVYLSTDALSSPEMLKQIFAQRRSWLWFARAFLAGPVPVLRCSLMMPDNPADPFVFESPLNICNGDVQEFCKAAVQHERLDLIAAHEGLSREEYGAVSFRAPGIRSLLLREFNSASRALKSAAAADEDFAESVDLMEQQFTTAWSGLVPGAGVRLEYAGAAQNQSLDFER